MFFSKSLGLSVLWTKILHLSFCMIYSQSAADKVVANNAMHTIVWGKYFLDFFFVPQPSFTFPIYANLTGLFTYKFVI